VRLVVDFNRLEQHPGGTEFIVVGAVTAPALAGLGLHEGMRAVFEERGELQMTGILHRRAAPATSADSPDTEREIWEGELDPHSTTYHVRVEPQTLYYAGPEGFGRSHEWVAVADADTRTAAGGGGEGGEAGHRDAQPWPRLETRPRQPSRMLTLGVEGTYEEWHRSLAALTVRGEAALVEGERVVLIDEGREVDAIVRVLRLPPDERYTSGRRIWLVEPAWDTVRPNPIPLHSIPEL
jgi:hypothetical protein